MSATFGARGHAMQLTVTDAARLLNVSEDELNTWIDAREIPVYRVNEQHLFNRAELVEWATSRGMPVTLDLIDDDDDGSFAAALQHGGVHYDVGGVERRDVIRAAVSLLRIPEEEDRELILEILLSRATSKSTVGGGIAIPHVRSPIVLHGARPLVALCFLARPVDFEAVDREPITTLFMMITPTPRHHLHLLSRLSSMLHDAAFKEALSRRAPAGEILREVRRIEASIASRASS